MSEIEVLVLGYWPYIDGIYRIFEQRAQMRGRAPAAVVIAQHDHPDKDETPFLCVCPWMQVDHCKRSISVYERPGRTAHCTCPDERHEARSRIRFFARIPADALNDYDRLIHQWSVTDMFLATRDEFDTAHPEHILRVHSKHRSVSP